MHPSPRVLTEFAESSEPKVKRSSPTEATHLNYSAAATERPCNIIYGGTMIKLLITGAACVFLSVVATPALAQDSGGCDVYSVNPDGTTCGEFQYDFITVEGYPAQTEIYDYGADEELPDGSVIEAVVEGQVGQSDPKTPGDNKTRQSA